MATIKIDLENELGVGQYVEIRDPKFLPWGVQKQLQTSLKDNSVEAQVDFAEKLAVALVKNGNVFDEDGNAIQFPLNTDSITKLPAVVVEAVALKFGEIRGKGPDVPKK